MSSTPSTALSHFIGLEEHWLSSAVDQSIYKNGLLPQTLVERLCNASSGRIAEMDSAGFAMQVLSHAPGYSTDLTNYTAVNDEMAAVVAAQPARFAALAHLPMASPDRAAEELRRCVQVLEFRGALVDNHASGRYYEGTEYDVFWLAAQELDTPIYLHPTFPTDEMNRLYQGNFSPQAAMAMSTSALGWHYHTANHVLRLYAGGVFDRFPRLKIILGHFGEGLPFFKERLTQSIFNWGDIKRKFDQVYGENLWFTTSSLKGVAPLACLLQNTKVERIMFSMDYPFFLMEDAIDWVRMVKDSRLLTEEQLELIAYKNAQKLLRLG